MPINPSKSETEEEFISRCMSEEKDSFPESGQRYAVCKSKWDNQMKDEVSEEAQQGGVVSPASFARTKFEFTPNAKEKMNDFMSRCMSDSLVKERKPSRVNRAGFCYSEYQNRYIMTIGRKWS